MKFTRNEVNGINDTILASNDYTAIPFTVAGSAVVKAGCPMTKAGAKAAANASDAYGILLYDVDPTENPNGALLIRGVIDAKKAQTSSSFTYDSTAITGLKTSVPGIFCREDIGTNS